MTSVYGGPAYGPNPVANYMNDDKAKSWQFIGNTYLEYRILDGLKIRGDLNISNFQNTHSLFSPQITNLDMSHYPGYEDSPNEARLSEEQYNTTTTSLNFRADYALNKNEHHLNAMVGYGWDREFATYRGQSYHGFPDDKVLIDASSAIYQYPATSGKSTSGLNSVYARLSYSYADRYLAEINFRSDASSKFGPGNKRGYFPAASLGWRISNEQFMEKTNWMDDLKLRLSWGKTGSTNIDDFTFKQFYIRNQLWGGLPVVGLKPTLPNKDVKWEMTREYNVGVDFSFFEHYLFGSIDAYWRKTDGALMPAPFPEESGMESFTANLTDMTNNGLEIEIGSDILRQSDWRWTATFNIAFNRNKIKKLHGANINPYMMNAFTEGYPAGISKGYLVERIIQSQSELDAMQALAEAHGYPYYLNEYTGIGDFKYIDTNNDGHITSDDAKNVIASPEPDFFGGFVNTLGYKNWNLSFVFQFSKGAQAILNDLMYSTNTSPGQSIHRELYHNTWTPENSNARYARQFYSYVNDNSNTNDRFVYETSYLRLKNITLSYNLPKGLLQKFNIHTVTLLPALPTSGQSPIGLDSIRN